MSDREQTQVDVKNKFRNNPVMGLMRGGKPTQLVNILTKSTKKVNQRDTRIHLKNLKTMF